MDAADAPISSRAALKGLAVFAALVGGPLFFCLGVHAMQESPVIPAGANIPVKPETNSLLPQGDGLRDPRDPRWSSDPYDPFPMPPELAGIARQARATLP